MEREALLRQLKREGMSKRIVSAFAAVPREKFVPRRLREAAYADCALPLDVEGATISQPSTIAFMLMLLDVREGQKVLEIGSGSGYVLALLAELVGPRGNVWGVELEGVLARNSRRLLKSRKNVGVVEGDGSQGIPKEAPFERMLISASCRETPTHLLAQLTENGVLVAPVGMAIVQLRKKGRACEERVVPGFVFVPLRSSI